MNKKATVFILDDDDINLMLLEEALQDDYLVITEKQKLPALMKIKSYNHDIILLDVMMPQMDGMEMCAELRKLDSFQDTLVVFLSARAEDFSQLAGYDAGANDYILKPIKSFFIYFVSFCCYFLG